MIIISEMFTDKTCVCRNHVTKSLYSSQNESPPLPAIATEAGRSARKRTCP